MWPLGPGGGGGGRVSFSHDLCGEEKKEKKGSDEEFTDLHRREGKRERKRGAGLLLRICQFVIGGGGGKKGKVLH